ncbi:ABC transporter permease [Mycoplasmatota bacterium WC44]
MNVILTIWKREFLKFVRQRNRLINSVFSPLVLILVFSFALSGLDVTNLGVSTLQYLLPGIIGMTAFTSSMAEAVSLVEDKTSGFMKEFLVSPIKRSELALGRMLGDSTKAIFDSIIIFIVSIIVGCRYSFLSIVLIIISVLLVSLTGAAFGILIANRSKSTKSFRALINLTMLPAFFLSGAYVPIQILPKFIQWIALINPVTYITSFFRYISLIPTNVSTQVFIENGIIIRIQNIMVNPFISFGIVVMFGIAFFLLSVKSFKKINATKKISLYGNL